MKRFSKLSMQGVTLLEIMLVLAIAAMVIVMSVRYYQSASQSQQANSFVQQVQGITAAAESLAQGGAAGYPAANADIAPLLPNNAFVSPWGGSVTYAGAGTGFTINANPACSTAVGTLVRTRLQSDKRFTVGGNCSGISYSAVGGT